MISSEVSADANNPASSENALSGDISLPVPVSTVTKSFGPGPVLITSTSAFCCEVFCGIEGLASVGDPTYPPGIEPGPFVSPTKSNAAN